MDDALLADLAQEHQVLDDLVSRLAEHDWDRPTPAEGWTVADQIHHLTETDAIAVLALAGGEIPKLEPDPQFPALAQRPAGSELLAAWRRGRGELLERAAAVDSRDRVDWVVEPVSARTLVTTRLTECWAHGLDCFDALGVAPADTDRLRHVVHQSFRVLPYALSVDGASGPVEELALDLTGPGGDRWWYGPTGTTSLISGPAGEWCRVAVRRLDPASSSLVASDPLAASALRAVRTYV